MLLAVDVGNTNTTVGLVDRATGRIVAQSRLSSVRDRAADEWLTLLGPLFGRAAATSTTVEAVVIASVVPTITRSMVQASDLGFGLTPLVVSADLDLGIAVKTDHPHEVGADRLVNSAYGFLRFGGPLIVVDLGTATKIEAVSAEGDYVGGVIAPGLGLSLDTLAARAARLYAVELKPPAAAIGRNTIASVQSGVVLGHVAMIEGMVERVRGELGGAERIVLTGGYGAVVAPLLRGITDVEPDLTLLGLHAIHERCQPRDGR